MQEKLKKCGDLHGEIILRQGYVILPGICDMEVTRACLNWVNDNQLSLSIRGNDQEHSWREISGPLPEVFRIGNILEISKRIITGNIVDSQWVNVYDQGQYIEGHCDAGGDLQALICLEKPIAGDGGDFWVNDCKNIVPIGEGDGILFFANKILHGTTEIAASSKLRRVTINWRFHATTDCELETI